MQLLSLKVKASSCFCSWRTKERYFRKLSWLIRATLSVFTFKELRCLGKVVLSYASNNPINLPKSRILGQARRYVYTPATNYLNLASASIWPCLFAIYSYSISLKFKGLSKLRGRFDCFLFMNSSRYIWFIILLNNIFGMAFDAPLSLIICWTASICLVMWAESLLGRSWLLFFRANSFVSARRYFSSCAETGFWPL